MKHAFAPHLFGRMLPGLFSCDLKIGQRERFPGDPWPHFPASPSWHWMHSTGCDAGLFRSRPAVRQRCEIEADWVNIDVTPSPQAAGIDRADVGPMRARQPADAGPPEGQRQLFAEITS